ncbi:virulence factor TspB C-terminal domain-related protein [Collimonas antrihumi]|uniref:virulence factor TspB C-terminal domain-related protein n=1 Tax=Collimonas antrihumi TaxID=1940615 RepID=UPI001B8D99C5|nr:virulence factor TspB C-terminal domain-related protein [Collimonas antrihumi]
MIYFLKRILVSVCIALVLMLVHKVSHAVDYYWVHPSNNSAAHFPDAVSACIDYEKTNEAQFGWVYDHIVMDSTTAYCYAQQGGPVAFRTSVRRVGASCPVGTVYNSTTGSCDNACPAGKSVSVTLYGGKKDTPTYPKVANSCQFNVTELGACRSYYVSGTSGPQEWWCDYKGTYNGTAAPAGTDPTSPGGSQIPNVSTNPPYTASSPSGAGGSCPAGTQNVGTDSGGTPICSGTGTAPQTPTQTTTTSPTTTTNNADGSTTTTGSTTTGNSDGSQTTITTTCTTSASGTKTCSATGATTANGSGGAGKNDSTDDKKNDFCAQHSNLDICINNQVSGTCQSISVSGDAILGALYKKEAMDVCAAQSDSDAQGMATMPGLRATDTAGAEADALAADPTHRSRDIDVNKQFSDAQQQAANDLPMMGGGATCPAPMSITVFSKAISIPFDQLCGMAQAMRVFVILAAGMLSMKIMMRVGS